MAAANIVGTSRYLVSLIVSHLSDMTFRVRSQHGPDQPVEYHEYRPTLVPAILVNRAWADIVTDILWKRYPHLPALAGMSPARQQWYADKVERLLIIGQSWDGDPSDLAYLKGVHWSNLKTLEVIADWKTYEALLRSSCMNSGIIEHVDLFGPQSGGSKDFEDILRGTSFILLTSEKARRLRLGPDVTDPEDPVDGSLLLYALRQNTKLQELGIMNFCCSSKDKLIRYLCHRKGLLVLEIDFDPGLELLLLFSGPDALRFPFACLLRLNVVCYPEIALALTPQLLRIRHLQLSAGRVPDHEPQPQDSAVLNRVMGVLAASRELRTVKIHVGQLSRDFPSASTHLSLSGSFLTDVARGCLLLRELTLSTLQSTAIDSTNITAGEFEQFCEQASNIRLLSIKFLPSSVANLESCALECLGTHCSKIEVLRLKSALQLPTTVPPNGTKHVYSEILDNNDPPAIMLNGKSCIDFANLDSSILSSHRPFFRYLTHLAFARPHTILSADEEASSLDIDPSIQKDLVGTWAQNLLANFPRLEVLEAWGDWKGINNESLNYFLPREEILATTWEFLSGVEQNLCEDSDDAEDIATEAELPIRGRDIGEDWKRASSMNEYHE